MHFKKNTDLRRICGKGFLLTINNNLSNGKLTNMNETLLDNNANKVIIYTSQKEVNFLITWDIRLRNFSRIFISAIMFLEFLFVDVMDLKCYTIYEIKTLKFSNRFYFQCTMCFDMKINEISFVISNTYCWIWNLIKSQKKLVETFFIKETFVNLHYRIIYLYDIYIYIYIFFMIFRISRSIFY